MPFLGADFLAILPGLFSTDVETSTAALETFIRLTTSADPAPEDLYLALGYNSVVSAARPPGHAQPDATTTSCWRS